MSTYLTTIDNTETKRCQSEMRNQLVGTYSDGTTHQGEAFAVINRWADDDLNIKLRAIAIKFLEGSLNHNEISSVLIHAEAEDAKTPLSNILAFMYDSVSANLS